MGCRGICTRLAARRPARGSAYAGRCRCNSCDVWLLSSEAASAEAAGRCPCCRQRVRFARRGLRYPAESRGFCASHGTDADMHDDGNGFGAGGGAAAGMEVAPAGIAASRGVGT